MGSTSSEAHHARFCDPGLAQKLHGTDMEATYSRSLYSKGSAFRAHHYNTQDSRPSSLPLRPASLCICGSTVQAFIQHKLLLVGSVLLLLKALCGCQELKPEHGIARTGRAMQSSGGHMKPCPSSGPHALLGCSHRAGLQTLALTGQQGHHTLNCRTCSSAPGAWPQNCQLVAARRHNLLAGELLTCCTLLQDTLLTRT